MPKSIEQQLADLQAQADRLKARKKKQDAQRDRVVGRTMIEAAGEDPKMAKILHDCLNKEIKKQIDVKAISALMAELESIIETSQSEPPKTDAHETLDVENPDPPEAVEHSSSAEITGDNSEPAAQHDSRH